MRKNTHRTLGRVVGAITVVGWLFCVAPLASSQGGAQRLQGQVPLADQLNGRGLMGYKKNVRVIGHNDVLNRLNNGNLGWLDDCAYVSAYYGANDVTAGLAIIDASRPRNPRLVRILPGVPGSRESQVEASENPRQVVVMTWPTNTYFGDPPAANSVLWIYDVGRDCTNLTLRSKYDFGTEGGRPIITHEHALWRDKIYVTMDVQGGAGPPLSVIDVSDRDRPMLIAEYRLPDQAGGRPAVFHDLELSTDGTRAYLSQREPPFQGMSILDTSQVAAWKRGMPLPTITRVSPVVYWSPPMPGASHSTMQFKVQGRKYVLTENEGAGGSPDGQCPAGWAQIADVNDERNPTIISSFLLDVNRIENCERIRPDHDGIPTTGPISILQNGIRYNSHYLGVDDPEDAKLAAFTWYSSGLRIVDISDPYFPKEVGYFIPPTINLGGTRSYPDRAYSFVRFHRGNIWFNSINGGFWIVRYTGDKKDSDVDAD